MYIGSFYSKLAIVKDLFISYVILLNQQFNCDKFVYNIAQMLKILHWPFKGFRNFAIASIGVIAVGFWTFSIYSEGKFNQPIIGQSIKLLGKHPQIKELAGFPLSYSFSLGNRFVEKQGQSYFSFNVKGPKSQTNVEMTASFLPAADVYNFGEKKESIAKIEQSILDQQELIRKLQSQIKTSPSKKQKQLTLQKMNETNKLKQFQNSLIQAKYEIIQKQNKYFVPSKQTYTKANDPRSKQNHEPLKKDEVLWGINDLVITLPNRTKMIVFPQPKKTFQQKSEIVNRYEYPDTPTLSLINKKITIDISQFSKEEIQEYGKQKTNFMYSKYGSYRIFTMVLFVSSIIAMIFYKQKTILKSIKGSILEQEVKRRLSRNDNLTKIMKQRNKKELQYDNLIGGGMADNKFNCVMYVKNLTNGRIEFQGKYLQDLNVYQFERLILKYRVKQDKREIDLLK